MNDDLDKTMIIPNPGGRRKVGGNGGPASSDKPPASPVHSSPSSAPPAPPASAAPASIEPFSPAPCNGENPLLDAATEILILANNLRSLEPGYSVEQVRTDIEGLILKFDTRMEQQGTSQEMWLTARYLICCLIDELVLATPWGADSVWSHQTLLSKYHNETSGGEKFFLIVDKLLENPQRNIDLIELAYVCISAGFRGKYRVYAQTEQEIMAVAQRLYQPIEQVRPVSRDLSPQWQGEDQQNKGFARQFPSAIYFLSLGFLVVMIYIAFLTSLNSKVEPVYAKIEQVGWDGLTEAFVQEQDAQLDINAIADALRLKLGDYIEADQVAVDARNHALVIRLISTSLFDSGSSYINEDALPDVNVLTSAIRQYASRVLVVGHTDSTGKPESNWVISRKRAEAIAAWLGKAEEPLTKTITHGVADTQPLVVEDGTDLSRSMNRRVELILALKG